MRSLRRNRPRSVARQVFVLQVAVVVLLAAGAVLALVLQSRHDVDREARARSVAVAETFAHSLGLHAALQTPDPTKILQPLTEETRKAAGVDFIVVMDTEGIRYTHPLPDRIGKKFVGTIEPSLNGEVYTESVKGPLGQEIQAVVPVFTDDGQVEALVSAGLTVENVTGVVNRQLPVILGASAAALALATAGAALISRRLRRQTHGLGPLEMTRMYEHHDAVLHAVREGVLITDGAGVLLLANDEAKRLLRLPADAEGQRIDRVGLDRHLGELLLSRRVATDEVHEAGERLLVINQRPTKPGGGPEGAAVTIRDSTEMQVLSTRAEAARRRLKLLYDAGVGVGTTLDVEQTAQELADVAVPRFADFATVDLAEPVLHGEEPTAASADLRRTGFSGIHDDVPLYPRGRLIDFVDSTPQARGLSSGRAEVVPQLADATGWHAQDPPRARAIIDYGVHSLITAPLKARGVVLGVVNFWRSQKPEPFDEEDLSLAEELVARAGVSIDNARRYTREHTLAVTLQRSLLPRDLPEQSAVEVAHYYLPAQSGVGGDWFDVIPLPGSRVALVVGDVVGHGLHAAAAMGRLRTAVLNFSSLDLPPDELLARLDDLVQYIDQSGGEGGGAQGGLLGATCMYAVYDAVNQRCTVARAGHVPPAVVRPDGTVEIPELPAGAPLGLGGFPFESAELQLSEGTQLVLYTDGLVEDRTRDIDEGLDLLRAALAHADRKPAETCRAVLERLLPVRPRDDVALLVARTSALPADHIAEWDVPFEPSAVGGMRALAMAKLEEWGLSELTFGTELVLSELITNAIRHGAEPVRVRLLLDRVLTCEVFDGSSSSPRLHYATTTDEGGRGLFLVAQLSRRWGARYTPEGKVIWSEQALPDPEAAGE
ncbi:MULTISPECIES: SpoIIE family protein phosphatase/ATP-binding protein [unclassified Streptomyces]|uniref:SpoIIE family protein phosphatase/ATP-binding protein n=1 Tax=unclassified Streptomyces TaxID=2593676 RepID=UPI00224CA227|nr:MULTISPECIES: SpoIIE family protein phosphatase/ATP-binding protein [unclassified Streptomyces]MCX4529628.1 SpoIIE family protein phosphatase [Streptomyces sp. NBC_01551]MCX4539801.1 SpoIIE family protein phosphatase [Streptomyces sp. NBC_01565]